MQQNLNFWWSVARTLSTGAAEGEDMAYNRPPRRRSVSGFLFAEGIVGELINVWGSGCVGQRNLWLGHVAPRGR